MKIDKRVSAKVATLVSGGVDSSVALCLLREQGHDLTAFYLKIWLEDELAYLGECPWEEDLKFVREICEAQNVPLEIISLQKEYWDEVIEYTLSEVKAGRTPNPDILCNERIKFGKFYQSIDDSFEKVATGHYARLEEKEGMVHLKTGRDPLKDQTYFLAQLNQAQLKRALFPIGEYTKAEVRKKAQDFELPNQARKDSQGLCFLGKIRFDAFLKHHLGEKKGDLIEFETGKKVGEHVGFWYYTLGQRKGIGLSGGPWYVVKKDPIENVVFVSNRYHAEDKVRNEFEVEDLNWNAGFQATMGKQWKGKVKVRHGEHFYDAKVDFLSNGKAKVALQGNDQGIAPGQFAVFYDDEACLGCGVIQI